MKKSLFICFVVISFFADAQTSVYHPFPDSNAVWIVQKGCCVCCCNSSVACCNFTARYEMTGDTVINAKTYHKIQSLETYSCTPLGCPPCMQPDWEVKFIREDTSKIVWWLDTFLMTDTILYDFNLNLGDTIHSALSYTSSGAPNIVLSIDSVLIGTNYRKRYWYSSDFGVDSCTHFLIEGIGTGAGLFSPLCGNGCFEHGFQLSCFKQDGNVLYFSNSSMCVVDTNICNFNVSVEKIKSEEAISLSPNPATRELRIKNSELRIEKIEIYDVLGQKYNSAFYILNSEFVVDVRSLPAGIYFVYLTVDKGDKMAKKFVKM